MDEKALVQRAAEGDRDAFELIVRRHSSALWRVARTVVADDQVAEDVVQDTFVKAHGALQTFQGASTLQTWLAAICYRVAVDRVRRKRLQLVPLEGDHAHVLVEDVDLRIALRDAVDELPGDEREAFQLIDVLGYSSAEAAAIVGVPASTIRSRLAKARARLARALGALRTAAVEEPKQ